MLKTIMAVDGSDTMRRMLSLTLAEAGYRVIEARDGKDALSKLAQNRVHMILTDLTMVAMEGIELMRQVRNTPSHRAVPIVMLTAESRGQEKQEGKGGESSGWSPGPIRPDRLLALIRRVLG